MTGAFICGVAGVALTRAEQDFLRDAQPWGVILFRRNVASPAQVRALTESIRNATECAETAILVDQEGGRVQRLAGQHWRAYPRASLYEQAGADLGERLAWLGARLIAHDLREVGITIDCLPVLDAPQPSAHDVIGDRAYSRDPARVSRLGRAAAEGLLAGGVLPVMKHIPGHGRARCDSHHELPVVDSAYGALERADFHPFAVNADLPIAMTAHVVYSALDPSAPATLSALVIQETIRKTIGFDGLLMTDDLSMKALSGAHRDRAARAIGAGCDIALHCNGDLAEARAVADGAGVLAGRALERAQAACARLERIDDFNPVDAVREFEAGLATTA
jgi:beta-N-acetylhexosaminidase